MRLTFSIKLALLSIVVCVFFTPDKYSLFDSNVNIFLTSISLINVFVYFNTVKRFYKSWFRYDVLFIIGFLIVHFQIPFLESVGIPPERPDFIWINKKVVNFATWFSTLALLLWILGFYMYLRKKKPVATTQHQYKIDKSIFFDFIFIASFIIFVLLVGSSFWSGNYSGTDNWGVGATYAALILKVMLTLSIIYFFINNKGRLLTVRHVFFALLEHRWLFLISIIYFLMFLYVGDRGPIMQLGITYLLCYTLFQKRISFVKLFTIIIVGATFFTIIEHGRTRDATYSEGNILTVGYDNFIKSDTQFNPTNELATSVRILYRALDVVPDYHPFLYGTTLVSNIIDVVPMSSTFYEVPTMYSNSTTFFTVLGQGEHYSYGEGSEILADLYINLGFWITLIVFLFFGYFLSFLTYNVHFVKNHSVLIIYVILTLGAIYINRSNFLNPLKFIIYSLFIDYVLTKKIK